MENKALEHKKKIVRKEAFKENWKIVYFKFDKNLYGFRRDKCFMDVYVKNMNVITILEHPTKGFKLLHRNNISIVDLISILKNPRAHTGRGRY